MSFKTLEAYLPNHCNNYLKSWFSEYYIHIKITKDRNSKLGDYRKLPDQSHQITINSTLDPELFFFVLTHELAHLIAFEKFGRRISPHGKEWKTTFANMLKESLQVYKPELQKILLSFSKNPKANFMSSHDLVRYFHADKLEEDMYFIENLDIGNTFFYKDEEYIIEEKRKKLYLCLNYTNRKKYLFKPLAKVKKNNYE